MTTAIATSPAEPLTGALNRKTLRILAFCIVGAGLILAASGERADAGGCAGTPLTIAEAKLPALPGTA